MSGKNQQLDAKLQNKLLGRIRIFLCCKMPQPESVAVFATRCETHRHSSVHEVFVSVAVDQHPELKSQMTLSLHSLCVGIQILHQGLEEVEWFNHSCT